MGILQHIAEGASGGASDGLVASAITGAVTICVTLIGVFATRARPRHRQGSNPNPGPDPNTTPPADPPRDDNDMARAEISDLKSQRNKLQRKLDESLVENERLRRLCWDNHINPYPAPPDTTQPLHPTDDDATPEGGSQ